LSFSDGDGDGDCDGGSDGDGDDDYCLIPNIKYYPMHKSHRHHNIS
jgi:hypothetical protein